MNYSIVNNVAGENGDVFYNSTYSYLDGNGTNIYTYSVTSPGSYTPTAGTVEKKISSYYLTKIATVGWSLYGIQRNNSILWQDGKETATDFYNYERNIKNSGIVLNGSVLWYGKVGLMYVSDYGYRTNGDGSLNGTFARNNCLNYKMLSSKNESDYSDYKLYFIDNNYLSYTNVESETPSRRAVQHLMTKDQSVPYSIDRNSEFTANTTYRNFGVKRVLYLKPDVIISGNNTGT